MATPVKIDGQQYDSTAQRIFQRYVAMNIPKYEVKTRWDNVRMLYDVSQNWLVHGESYDTAVRFPTLRDFISSLVDRYMQNPPEAEILCTNKNRKDGALAMKSYIDNVKDSIHEKKIRRECAFDMFFYGKGVRSVLYRKWDKNIDGETQVMFDDIATNRVDPRNVFIDETCYNIHDKLGLNGARDVIIRNMYAESTFRELFKDPKFKNVDKVQAMNWFSDEMGGFMFSSSQREVIEKSPVNMVKVYEYMNQQTNEYILVANGYTIYESTLTEAKGICKIPLVEYNFEPRNDSIWGTTLAELLAPHIWLEDTLINLEIMNLKLTLQPILAVSGEFGYNPRVHVLQPGGVWTAGGNMNGKIQDNIQPLVTGNPNTNFYNFHNLLDNKFTITSRSDIRSLEDTQNKTATEVSVQNRAYNVHNENIESINEIEAEAILTEMMIDITKKFINVKNDKGEYRKVPIKGYMVNQSDGQLPQFIEKAGADDFFELTEEIINTDVYVKVIDKRSEVSTKMEKLGRLWQFLPMATNTAMAFPDVAERLNPVGIIEQMAELLNLDMQRTLKEDMNEYLDEFGLLKEEILLGHNIDIPEDETRRDSLRRMQFLYSLRFKKNSAVDSKEWDSMSKQGKMAWQYHVDQCVANITANQIEKKKNLEAQKQQEKIMAQQQAQGIQPGQQQIQTPTNIPQPNAEMMSAMAGMPGNQPAI